MYEHARYLVFSRVIPLAVFENDGPYWINLPRIKIQLIYNLACVQKWLHTNGPDGSSKIYPPRTRAREINRPFKGPREYFQLRVLLHLNVHA